MALQQITCPYCGKPFEAEEGQTIVHCPACTGEIPLPIQVQPRPDSAGLVYDPVAALVDDAYLLLDTDMDSAFYDGNVKKAEAIFREALQRDSHCAPAWKGLFDCAVCETRKTFWHRKKIEDTEYWLDGTRRQSSEWYRVDSCFCRAVVRQGKATAFIVDELLQPGRKAKMYIDNAIHCAPPDLREGYLRDHQAFFEQPLAELAAAGHAAILAARGDEADKKPRRGPAGRAGASGGGKL